LVRATESSELWITDIENLRIHYAETLSRWHQRFSEKRKEVEKLYDERFFRMWEMYLIGCEMTFRFQYMTVLQLQLSREIDALPITRDYMMKVERALARKDS
jgi:cyclopropane-fatty-acyl-phospholipid synthase